MEHYWSAIPLEKSIQLLKKPECKASAVFSTMNIASTSKLLLSLGIKNSHVLKLFGLPEHHRKVTQH